MQTLVNIVFGVLLVVHGCVHLLGGLSEFKIADFNNLEGKLLFYVPAPVRKILAALWLTATALFLASGIAFFADQPWWFEMALSGVIISQALIIIWWHDAKWGTLPNLLVALGLYFLK